MAASTDTLADDRAAFLGAWNEVIRRARISPELKLAMLVLGSYANADGTGIYCGVARLAVDCGVSYRTASRYLAWARRVGLVLLVKRGNRRRGWADVYRLILDPVLLDHIELPDPEQYRKLCGEIAAANRADTRRRQSAGRTREDASFTDTTDDRRTAGGDSGDLRTQGDRRNDALENGSTDTLASVGTRSYGHEVPSSTDTPGVLPPSMDHLTSTNNLPWEPTSGRDARYHLRVGAREDGQDSSTKKAPRPPGPTCAACQAELDPDGSCFICRIPARSGVRA